MTTLLLVSWLAVSSYLLIFKTEDEDLSPERVFYINKIWFGDESIVSMLSGLWYYVIFFIVIGPYLGNLTKFIKLLLLK